MDNMLDGLVPALVIYTAIVFGLGACVGLLVGSGTISWLWPAGCIGVLALLAIGAVIGSKLIN